MVILTALFVQCPCCTDTSHNFMFVSMDTSHNFMFISTDEPQYNSEDGDNCAYMPVTKLFEWETRPCGDKLGYICRKSGTFIRVCHIYESMCILQGSHVNSFYI